MGILLLGTPLLAFDTDLVRGTLLHLHKLRQWSLGVSARLLGEITASSLVCSGSFSASHKQPVLQRFGIWKLLWSGFL